MVRVVAAQPPLTTITSAATAHVKEGASTASSSDLRRGGAAQCRVHPHGQLSKLGHRRLQVLQGCPHITLYIH